MEAVGLTSSIIAVLQLTTKIVQYFNGVKKCSREQKQCAQETANLLMFLTKLKFRIEDANPKDPWYINVLALEAEGGELRQFEDATQELVSHISREGRLSKIGTALAWPFSRTEIADILTSIERLKSFITLALELDHFILSEAIKKETEILPVVASHVKVLKSVQDERKIREIADWLSPLDPSQQYNAFIAQRCEGTGDWFLQSPQFLNWVEGSTAALFCPGRPGAGKTIISSLVIQYLQDTMDLSTDGLAYLFLDYKSQEKQRSLDLLLAVLKQLVMRLPIVPQGLEALHEKHGREGSKLHNIQQVVKYVEEVAGRFNSVYFVIDALDESSDVTRDDLISRLKDLQGVNIKIMITSRRIGTIEEDITAFDDSDILEIVADGGDIERFVEGELPRLAGCISRNESLKQLVTSSIVEKADKMFILARLYFELLVGETTAKRIRLALQALPKGSAQLSKAYEKTISRLHNQSAGHVDIARTVLGWIVNTKRPLKTKELQHALATEVGESDLDPDNITDMSYILSACVGLVVVEAQSQDVRLIHYTAYEYLSEVWPSWLPESQNDIAERCITYLLFDTFGSGACSDRRETSDRLESYALFDYATKNWGYHAYAASMQKHPSVLKFLSSKKNVSAASQVMFPGVYGFSTYVDGISGLHLAAHFGLKETMKALFDADYYLHDGDCNRRTPIFYAVANGQEETVQWLLHKMLSISNPLEAKDISGETLLSFAAIHGQYGIVKLLLGQKDVDVNHLGNRKQAPLSHAAEQGHPDIVKLLLSTEGVRVDVGWPALKFAAGGGHLQIVRMLLEDSRVDVNARGFSDETPLAEAAHNGHNEIVKLLLARPGLDVGVRDDRMDTSLALAAQANQYFTVELLLQVQGIDPNSESIDGTTALAYAASLGLPEILGLLLSDERVKADVQDRNGRTPLSLASGQSNSNVIRALLADERIDPNSQDTTGRTPLSHAVSRSSVELVQLLLSDARVDPELPDSNGRSPLSYAATRWPSESNEIFRVLMLNPRVKPDSRDSKGRSPFSYAVTKRFDEGFFKTLLTNPHVNPNSQDTRRRTPLSHAVETENVLAVKLLLSDDRVDPTLQDESGRSPWLYAASDSEELLDVLLADPRIDSNSRDYCGRNLLCYVLKEHPHSQSHHKWLLDKSVLDLNPRDAQGWTPFRYAAEAGNTRTMSLLLQDDKFQIQLENVDGQSLWSWFAERFYDRIVDEFHGNHKVFCILERDPQWFPDMQPHGRGGCRLRLEEFSLLALLATFINSHNGIGSYQSSRAQGSPGNAVESWHTTVASLILMSISTCDTIQGLTEKINHALTEELIDLHFKDKSGRNLLWWAARTGHKTIAQLLINQHVDIESKDDSSRTPLLTCAMHGHSEVLSVLLDVEGIDNNARDEIGLTALSLASWQGHAAIVKLLLEYKHLDLISDGSSNDLNPLHLAVRQGHEAVVRLLLGDRRFDAFQPDSTSWTPLMHAARNGHENIVHLLLDKEVEPDVTDQYSFTPLLLAVAEGHMGVVKALLKQSDVDPNHLIKSSGQTALHFAAGMGYLEIFRMLLDVPGIIYDAVDTNGQTPLWMAAYYGREEVVKILLAKRNVDTQVTNTNGFTPLAVACENRKYRVVRMLLDHEKKEPDVVQV